MSWAAVIGAGGAVVGGLIASSGSKSAANAQTQAAQQSAEMQRRNMLMQANIYEPQRNIGYQALNDLASLYGYSQPGYTDLDSLTGIVNGQGSAGMALGGSGVFGRLGDRIRTGFQNGTVTPGPSAGPSSPGQPGNFNRFFTSPDYQFRLNEGQRNVGNSFAARGGAASGNALRALTDFNQNMASAEYGNYFNRLAQMAGMGQVANQSVGAAGTNYANNAGNAALAAGDARASGVINNTNALLGGLQGVGTAIGNYFGGSGYGGIPAGWDTAMNGANARRTW